MEILDFNELEVARKEAIIESGVAWKIHKCFIFKKLHVLTQNEMFEPDTVLFTQEGKRAELTIITEEEKRFYQLELIEKK